LKHAGCGWFASIAFRSDGWDNSTAAITTGRPRNVLRYARRWDVLTFD
jgi:hypothetical protein